MTVNSQSQASFRYRVIEEHHSVNIYFLVHVVFLTLFWMSHLCNLLVGRVSAVPVVFLGSNYFHSVKMSVNKISQNQIQFWEEPFL